MRSLALFFLMGLPPGPEAGGVLPHGRIGGQEDGRLAELAARDERISFTSTSADRARAILSNPESSVMRRASALLALGECGTQADLPLLEEVALGGRITERRAALLALGSRGAEGFRSLRRLRRMDVEGLEESSVLAMVLVGLAGSSEALALVSEIAEDPGSPLSPAAQQLLGMAETGEPPAESCPSLDLYYELRWRAARDLGFVDGRRWKEHVFEELLASDEFLDRVVISAAAVLPAPSVRDHLLELVTEDLEPGTLFAVARTAPDLLERLFVAGQWSPQTEEEWRTLLEQLEDVGREREALTLVRTAFEHDEFRDAAGILLLRGGADLPWNWLAGRLADGPLATRTAIIEASGDRDDLERVRDLLGILRRDTDLDVSGPAMVALARLGHAPAREHIEELLDGEPSEERYRILVALSRVPHDPVSVALMESALRLPELERDARFRLQLGRALAGRFIDHRPLRAWFRDSEAGHPLRREVVRALVSTADEADLALLRETFPVEDDLELNVELALALLRHREPDALVILRTALWRDGWNRSVLAGGLLARATGIRDLVAELDSPPAHATAADLRRVGFAVGEWGGLELVEDLARRRKESDPALQGAFLGALSVRSH